MVFYRTYRPQTIADLDSQAVREALITILSSKDIPHAFLLSGPKGLGKTSAARIIAKVLNCEKKKGVEPCNKCEQCVSITNGTSLDILEIDAASNRGIDEMRSLRERVKLAPSSSSKKVYIIDEVHMLTNEAFNALLKTLEEPPSHVVFILCTTELHKVPQTIQSRCFHIPFKKANTNEIARSLKRIAVAEKIQVNESALVAIAKAAGGSFRDASKLLEQASLGKEKTISEDAIKKIVGTGSDSLGLTKFLKDKDVKGALSWLNDVIENGVDIKAWLEEYVAALHKEFLQLHGVEKGEENVFDGFTKEDIQKLIQLFSRAHQELKYAVIPQMPIEIAVIEYCTKGGD